MKKENGSFLGIWTIDFLSKNRSFHTDTRGFVPIFRVKLTILTGIGRFFDNLHGSYGIIL